MSAGPAYGHEPTAAYRKAEFRGFTVLISSKLAAHPTDSIEAIEELDLQLKKIVAAVPEKVLPDLMSVRIWMEWENRPKGAAEFHVSAGWLKQHGYNSDKAGCVEISNVRNFVKWSRTQQPWMVLHELAHAYHHHVLGRRYPGILGAHKQAAERKLYDSVLHVDGRRRKAYALTNEYEYFAELSEAYFGKNDFYPFDRAELKQHDPDGYRLMEIAWSGTVRQGKDLRPLTAPAAKSAHGESSKRTR